MAQIIGERAMNIRTQRRKYNTGHRVGSDSLGMALASIVALAMPILSASGWAQTVEWAVYNTSNSGLPFDLITALACDDEGTVWVGTGDPIGNGRGLAQFDGENWTVYNTSNSGLPHNAVFALAPDRHGGIWVGTFGGLAGVGRGLGYFDGQSWTVYHTGNSDLPHNNVFALALDDQETLWVGTDGGLARWDGTSWQVYNQGNSRLPHNSVYAIAIDEQGNKWIGTYGSGLARFDGSAWDVFNTGNSGLPHDNVYAIAIDSQGNKWIGTAVHVSGVTGGGLAMFDGQDWTVYNRSNSALPHNDVYAVEIGPDGSVWTGSGEHVPTSVGGLARFDGVDWTVYDKQNSGVPYNLVFALAMDRGGTIWAGSVNFDEVGGLVACRGVPVVDFNGDGLVNIKDLMRLIRSWDQDDPTVDIAPPPFGDGVVDALDLELLMNYWEQPVDDPTLLAHWALDETEGIIAYDTVGVNDAVVVGGTAWQPSGGKVDGALLLNGVDGCAIANQVMNPADGSFSVFAWIKGGEPGQVVISQQNGSNWLGTDPDLGCLMTELIPPAVGRFVPQPLISECVITDDQWHRIGFVWDGTRRILYVDDVEVAEDTQVNVHGSDGGLYIGTGKMMEPGTYFSGLIDDVRIYNRAVSP